MMLGTGIIGGLKDATVVYVDSGMSSSNASSYNFGTKSIGPAHPSRILIAWFNWNPQVSASFSHFSVDGNAMNFQFGNTVSPTGATIQMRTLPWPTGTTAAITMGASARMLSCYWMMWAAYYLKSETPTDAITALGFGSNPAVDNLNVEAGGIGIGATGAKSVTWTGLTKDTEQSGGIGGTSSISGASGAFHTAQSPLVVSSAAAANHINMLASFR